MPVPTVIAWPLARLALWRALEPRSAVALVLGWSLALGCRPRLLEDVARAAAGASPALEARRLVWTVALVLALPLLVLRAAALFADWRERERGWIGARPLTAGAALLWQAAGTWLAGLLALAATALAAELAAAGLGAADAPATRLVARLRHPALVVAGARPERRLPLDEALLAELAGAGSAAGADGPDARSPAAPVRGPDERHGPPAPPAPHAPPAPPAPHAPPGPHAPHAPHAADPQAPSAGTPALALGLRLVSLPGSAAGGRARVATLDGEGRVTSALECAPDAAPRVAADRELRALFFGQSAGAAFLVGRDSIELLDARSRERAASLALGLDALLAWSAWCALAFALGARLRPSLAALACLALLCLPLVPLAATRGLQRFVPGARLPERLAALERGLVPAAPLGRDWLVALGALACGAGLALVAARREP